MKTRTSAGAFSSPFLAAQPVALTDAPLDAAAQRTLQQVLGGNLPAVFLLLGSLVIVLVTGGVGYFPALLAQQLVGDRHPIPLLAWGTTSLGLAAYCFWRLFRPRPVEPVVPMAWFRGADGTWTIFDNRNRLYSRGISCASENAIVLEYSAEGRLRLHRSVDNPDGADHHVWVSLGCMPMGTHTDRLMRRVAEAWSLGHVKSSNGKTWFGRDATSLREALAQTAPPEPDLASIAIIMVLAVVVGLAAFFFGAAG